MFYRERKQGKNRQDSEGCNEQKVVAAVGNPDAGVQEVRVAITENGVRVANLAMEGSEWQYWPMVAL